MRVLEFLNDQKYFLRLGIPSLKLLVDRDYVVWLELFENLFKCFGKF